MYDYARPANPNASRDALHQRLRASWWILALAGVAALGLAVSIQPRPVSAQGESPSLQPSRPLASASPAPDGGESASAPRTTPDATGSDEAPPISLTDVGGKASLGLLLVYAVGWGLVKLRRGGWPPRLRVLGGEALPRRLQLAESLALGHQQATLHLVEVDGAALLLGSSGDQVSVLWTSSPVSTVVLPVSQPAPEPIAPVSSRPGPVAVAERKPLGGPPVRHEADWEQERSRLIRALVYHDEVA